MNYYIKQKVFSWSDTFFVYDQAGNEVYRVKGEAFSFGKKLHVYDMNGSEIAYINQKIFSFKPRFLVEIGGRLAAEVVKQITFFRPSYHIIGPDWSVNGDWFAHEYEISNGLLPIATISKQWFTFGDAYEISIGVGVDEILALCVALTVDACIEMDDNAR